MSRILRRLIGAALSVGIVLAVSALVGGCNPGDTKKRVLEQPILESAPANGKSGTISILREQQMSWRVMPEDPAKSLFGFGFQTQFTSLSSSTGNLVPNPSFVGLAKLTIRQEHATGEVLHHTAEFIATHTPWGLAGGVPVGGWFVEHLHGLGTTPEYEEDLMARLPGLCHVGDRPGLPNPWDPPFQTGDTLLLDYSIDQWLLELPNPAGRVFGRVRINITVEIRVGTNPKDTKGKVRGFKVDWVDGQSDAVYETVMQAHYPAYAHSN